ncbi:MAG: M14 family metallopeptidase [Symbiobacteriaceae bacterium]|nr:M14 family metallopeptidase [Symbiobacteriaceae bacterium]
MRKDGVCLLHKYDHYYTYAELTQALEKLQQSYPQLAKLLSIGKSPQGRDLWLMEITDPTTGTPCSKPAYYVDGNHHAGEVTGSMVALYAIDELLSRSSEPEFAQLLQRYTFYILPRISTDGAEHYLTTPDSLRSVPRPYPFVEQMPGLYPADIDGDGMITLMRVATPLGTWKEDPEDSRRMLRRLPDEEGGTYYAIYQEGLIHEYDGFTFESAPSRWGLDLNRNYPVEWGIEARQPGAGAYPLSEPETRAVVEFVMSHPNIGGAVTLHTTGGVILRPPGTKSERRANQGDVRIFKAIGEMAVAETGYPSVNIFDEFLGDTANFNSGAFDDWLYATQGIPAYTVELWDLGLRSGVKMWPRKDKDDKELAEDFAKVLAWIDKELEGVGFNPWTPFNHPQLGAVELGGFHGKFLSQNCPPALLEQECQKNARFFYRMARTLPRLEIASTKVERLENNTWKVHLEVQNLGYLPTNLTQMAREVRAVKPVKAELKGATIIDGRKEREFPQLEGRAGVGGSFSAGGFRGGRISRQKQHLSWVVQAPAGSEITISVTSQKAGNPEVKVTLQ